VERAVQEMVRVLRPGGTLLIADINGFATAVGG
jgi:ubiquinone/menaquinone biosynthesis C-methylase UbiE